MSCSFAHEKALQDQGYDLVAGVDEAGRGPLAGPVVAAAVILPPDVCLPGLNDSKKLTDRVRRQLFASLRSIPGVLSGVGWALVEEIDQLNILRATHLAMRRAVDNLPQRPEFVLIDGLPVPGFPWPSQGLVKGDSLSLSIAAASILAKVLRDDEMVRIDKAYPAYGFAKHKGYGTAQHLEALRQHGPSPVHRRSFAPVAAKQLQLSL
jgi:ribonuclease HII